MDFASGTSSRSTKLFHGGVRYLERIPLRLVQGVVSRARADAQAGRRLATFGRSSTCSYRGYPESMSLLNAGLTAYDIFSGSPLKRTAGMLRKAALLREEPASTRPAFGAGAACSTPSPTMPAS